MNDSAGTLRELVNRVVRHDARVLDLDRDDSADALAKLLERGLGDRQGRVRNVDWGVSFRITSAEDIPLRLCPMSSSSSRSILVSAANFQLTLSTRAGERGAGEVATRALAASLRRSSSSAKGSKSKRVLMGGL